MRAARVSLREVLPEDLPVFFENHRDPSATWMAAFTMADPSDRAAFDSHWEKILAHEHVTKRTILLDSEVVGNIMCYQLLGAANVAYWIWKEQWGKGIATEALRLFLAIVTERPLVGRTAADNFASRRVLEKCGFVRIDEERGFAHARGEKIDEIVFRLD
ncbi:MAG: GNAT family N-acetyltransferase [Gemmatimonadetes bacterium]|nr:GNAT family N-acetyltransferase [Gemmatimonadota bacterium]